MNLERSSVSDVVFAGPCSWRPDGGVNSPRAHNWGGDVAEAATVFHARTGKKPVIAALTGADQAGNTLCRKLAEFSHVRRAAVLTETPTSDRLDAGRDLDEASALGHLLPVVSAASLVVFGSWECRDGELLARCLDGCQGTVGVIVSDDQASDPRTTFDLLPRCKLAALTRSRLWRLTGYGNLPDGTRSLHERGVASVVIADPTYGHLVSSVDPWTGEPRIVRLRGSRHSTGAGTACGLYLACRAYRADTNNVGTNSSIYPEFFTGGRLEDFSQDMAGIPKPVAAVG